MTKFKEGDRVQYVRFYTSRPFGQVIEVQPEVRASGEVISEEKYRVRWDESQEESGWLSPGDLVRE